MVERVSVLVAAGGAVWEADALPAFSAAGVVVLKRCVDQHDLMASASSGQADVAIVSADLPGLDADCVMHLLRYDVRTLAVAEDPAAAERLARLGVVATVASGNVDELVERVGQVAAEEVVLDPVPVPPPLPAAGQQGRTIAVWGPTGAPGRSTVALGLAAERAHLGAPVVLVDADPYGGTVAQQLGVLDEVSGMLAAARLANNGTLDAGSFAGCRRRVGPWFDVLTGLPRPDRWVEVRAGVLERVLSLATEVGDVVVDCGFCLEEDDLGRSLGRNQLTLDALAVADEIVVVGSADPTGLARLARALVELGGAAPGTPVRVVVNRMRSTLGWSERDILGMVEGYVRPTGVHFVPEDRPAVDRALVAGKSLVELGDFPIRRQLAVLAAGVFADVAHGPVAAKRGQRRPRQR
ncbi:MAG: hypothetical protein M3Z50_14640 [Actinomycetota bacterium]|nr:hypothetical protein [Actinomycetota bacterium]